MSFISSFGISGISWNPWHHFSGISWNPWQFQGFHEIPEWIRDFTKSLKISGISWNPWNIGMVFSLSYWLIFSKSVKLYFSYFTIQLYFLWLVNLTNSFRNYIKINVLYKCVFCMIITSLISTNSFGKPLLMMCPTRKKGVCQDNRDGVGLGDMSIIFVHFESHLVPKCWLANGFT